MKVTFVTRGTENIGIECLSAALKAKGHEVELVFDRALFNDDTYINIPGLKFFSKPLSSLAKEIVDTKPAIVCFSVMTNNYQWNLSVAKELKKISDILIVFGGIHATLAPEEVISQPEVNIVCIGEGDNAIVELADSLEQKNSYLNIKNLWFKKNGEIIKNEVALPIANLDALPFPDKDIFRSYLPLNYYYLAVTSRGCPNCCSYCSEISLKIVYKGKGQYYRERSVKSVINEFLLMKNKYNFKAIDIRSSVLSHNKEWIREFVTEYKDKIKLPFRIMIHPNTIDKEIASGLKEAGCWQAQVGVQSFNEALRNKILHRFDTNKEIIAALDSLDAAGLRFSVDLMTGLPEEKKQDLLEAAQILIKYKHLYKVALFYLQYLPKAPILQYATQSKEIEDKILADINSGKGKNLLSASLKSEIDRLRNWQLLFRLLPILSPNTLKKVLKYKIHERLYLFPKSSIIILTDILSAIWVREYFLLSVIKGYFWEIGNMLKKSFKINKIKHSVL